MPVVNGLVAQRSGSCVLPPRGLLRLRRPRLPGFRYPNLLVPNVHVGEQGPNSLDDSASVRRRKPVELPLPPPSEVVVESRGDVNVTREGAFIGGTDEFQKKTSGKVMREVGLGGGTYCSAL